MSKLGQLTKRRNLTLGRAGGLLSMARVLEYEISAITGAEDDPVARDNLAEALSQVSLAIIRLVNVNYCVLAAHKARKEGVEIRKQAAERLRKYL